ncbi:MAG TPA: caspase family protein [Balneolaceae bacterium]|nr:caspase family protein [Balneolaceae bacterium]
MNKIANILIISLLFSFAACTSARWTVKDKSATDTSDFKILQQYRFLKSAGKVTPDNPTLTLDLLSRTKYQYSQRVQMQRNIQEYRLRPGFLIFGLSGAAAAFYIANSNTFRGNATSTKSLTLNAAGVLLTLSGFLNMKAVGSPRPTGEERYLRTTGHAIKIDTLNVKNSKNVTASVSVKYKRKVIFEEAKHSFSSGKLEIPLASKLNELNLTGPDPGNITITVNFSDSTYHYDYPVQSVLQPYARVNKRLTALRSSPEKSDDNVLADLAKGSQIRIGNLQNNQWYEVLYGVAKNYILKEDAEIVWQPSDFAEQNKVVTVPTIPFGNIDVESNIPILRGPNFNAYALIVTNQNYEGDMAERNYAHRDGKLMQQYLVNSLGFPQQAIFSFEDISSFKDVRKTLSDIKVAANDSTQLFIFLSGYGQIARKKQNLKLNFMGIRADSARSQADLDLHQFFQQISSIPSSKVLVLGDIDFSRSMTDANISANEQQRLIESELTVSSDSAKRISFLMGEHLDQPSSLYFSNSGEDKKHHIFPYFFAKALQQRKTTVSAIYQYLERNVSYTSRKLHDRPQDPLLVGNSSLDLIH